MDYSLFKNSPYGPKDTSERRKAAEVFFIIILLSCYPYLVNFIFRKLLQAGPASAIEGRGQFSNCFLFKIKNSDVATRNMYNFLLFSFYILTSFHLWP